THDALRRATAAPKLPAKKSTTPFSGPQYDGGGGLKGLTFGMTCCGTIRTTLRTVGANGLGFLTGVGGFLRDDSSRVRRKSTRRETSLTVRTMQRSPIRNLLPLNG